MVPSKMTKTHTNVRKLGIAIAVIAILPVSLNQYLALKHITSSSHNKNYDNNDVPTTTNYIDEYMNNLPSWAKTRATTGNYSQSTIASAIKDIRSTIKHCTEFECRGWPGRFDCTGILPPPPPIMVGNNNPHSHHIHHPSWSSIVSDKDCPRTKIGSWNFDGNSNMDALIFYLFFFPEMIRNEGSTPGGRQGSTVEFGAQNGIDASNSRFFERYLGWSSLLVEPTSCHVAVRRNRPHASVVHGAVCKDRRKITLPGSTKWCKNAVEMEITQAEDDVPCYPLRDLFEMHGRMSMIDFVTVDSEGMEMEALESIDFRKVDIRVMLVEWRNEDGSKRRDYLAKYGYLSTFISPVDELFWRPDLFEAGVQP